MSKTKIFFTGATGYIGGAVFAELLKNKDYEITALIRDQDKADKLKELGVTPVIGSLDDKNILSEQSFKADAVVHTAHADHLPAVHAIVEGLEKKFKETGKKGILVHTSGTGILQEDTHGGPISSFVWNDNDNDSLNKIPVTVVHRDVDTFLISHSNDITLVIVAPPTVFGIGSGIEGISNRCSQQIPLLINTALKHKTSFQVGEGKNEWSAVHVTDLAEFFAILLDKLLKGEVKDTGKNGYYLPEQGKWVQNEITQAIANYLVKKGLAKDAVVKIVNTPQELEHAFGRPDGAKYVSGSVKSKGDKARSLGWAPKHGENALMEGLEEEIDFVAQKASK